MVEKIYVRPEEVRGLGNIVIPKSLEDYETYKSVLAEGSDEVYGTVYTMDYLGVDGIVLSSDKSILSYADSDVASISAQLTYGGEPVAVSGEIVEFEVRKVSDDSLVRTLRPGRTDGTGTAVTSMVSSGSGDVYVKASYRSLVSKTYTLYDKFYYDDASSDKHSNWDTTDSNDTISYDSTNKHYVFTKTADGDAFIKLTNSIIPSNVKIEYDLRIPSTTKNIQPRIGLLNDSTGSFVEGRVNINNSYHTISWIGRKNGTWTSLPTTNVPSLSNGNWYHFELTFDGSDLTMKVYSGTTLLGTVTASLSDYLGQTNKLLIDSAYETGSVWNLKNLSVTPL